MNTGNSQKSFPASIPAAVAAARPPPPPHNTGGGADTGARARGGAAAAAAGDAPPAPAAKVSPIRAARFDPFAFGSKEISDAVGASSPHVRIDSVFIETGSRVQIFSERSTSAPACAA